LYNIYSKTSNIRAFTEVFPPVGSASTLPHTKHFTSIAALPKIICSFLHLGHLTFMNFEVGSAILILNLLQSRNLGVFISFLNKHKKKGKILKLEIRILVYEKEVGFVFNVFSIAI